MLTLEKLMLGIALLLILLSGLCESGEVSLKAFILIGLLDLFLLLKIAQKLDQLQQQRWTQEQQQDTDDEG